MLAGGVDTILISWVPYDGIGRDVRNGLNFTERGLRRPRGHGVSDRGHTAASQLRPDDVDWDHLFGDPGRALVPHRRHLRRRCPRPPPTSSIAAMEAAAGTAPSSPTTSTTGPACGRRSAGRRGPARSTRRIAGLVDVLIGNEEDFTAALGFDVPGAARRLTELHPDGVRARCSPPSPRTCPACGWRRPRCGRVTSATATTGARWPGPAGDGFVRATQRDGLEILDRVGGGDSFASGLRLRAAHRSRPATSAVEYGAAHGALAMTTPGDTSMATLAEVEALVRGAGARVQR